MPSLDALTLARVQFAFTVGFHIVFPAFPIGLAAYLMVLEGAWLRTGRQVYLDVSSNIGSRSSPWYSASAWSRV